MALTTNGFLDNLLSGLLGPKGNMADWQHARRLYVDDDLKLSPKSKFLYHVFFQFNPVARTILPELTDKHNLEIGMLVKSADLPKFQAAVETKNKYNRKKNIQTSVTYDPINITFHDDNYGVTTALMEAYYRYYFADGNYTDDAGAYNKAGSGDNTYRGAGLNQYKYGLDNNISVPFLNNIQITQLAKKTYTTYKIVNPLITNWQHDNLDNSSSEHVQNSITVAYEAVHYSRGLIEAGANGEPTGFGDTSHYDTQPSPISLLGGGTLGLGGTFGAGADLYDFISKGTKFKNPLEAGLAAYQILNNLKNLNPEALRAEGYSIITDAIGNVAGVDVSGVGNSYFPQNGTTSTTSATTTNLNPDNITVTNTELLNDPNKLEAAAFDLFKKAFLASGGSGGVNAMQAAWAALPESEKQKYRNRALGA